MNEYMYVHIRMYICVCTYAYVMYVCIYVCRYMSMYIIQCIWMCDSNMCIISMYISNVCMCMYVCTSSVYDHVCVCVFDDIYVYR